jgi:hypothetical protein
MHSHSLVAELIGETDETDGISEQSEEIVVGNRFEMKGIDGLGLRDSQKMQKSALSR